jgi:methionyl aminopeptidase
MPQLRPQMILRNIFSKGIFHSSAPGKGHNFICTRRLHVPSVEELESFGTYTLILPPEPYIEGVAHIPMKPVSGLIIRPPYMSGTPQEIISKASDPFAGDPYEGDGRIILGSNDETKLRRASKLAKLVLDRTKEWVKVD